MDQIYRMMVHLERERDPITRVGTVRTSETVGGDEKVKYAVVEWEGSYEDGDGWVNAIGLDLTEEFAQVLIDKTPEGYTREIMTMEEYEQSKREGEEANWS